MKSLKKLAVLLLVIVMLLSTLVLSASAAGTLACGVATVSADLLNIRSEPGTDASIVSRVSEDEKVVILEKTNAEWYKINSSGTVGYELMCALAPRVPVVTL